MRRVELVPDWLEGTRPTVSRVFAQRNRAEEKLNFQKTILEAHGEASVDGILVVSPEGNMISFNLFPMSSSYWST